MPAPPLQFEDLADAVLDGTPVDWAAAEAAAAAEARPLIRRLRLIASVAEVQRSEPLSETTAAAPAAPLAMELPGAWGHLRVLERVGQGAFGEVFRAWDTRLDREVALKLLTSAPVRGSDAASLIIGEGRLLAKVRHPNVVTIHGAEQIGPRVGLWMEFVRGLTLEQLIKRGRVFTPADVVAIGIEICRAVTAVHAAGLLHRDIKAQNVMRADDGRIVLMDFGAGREVNDGAAADVAGTPLYLAPEVLLGKGATPQTDIYSLGVLLFRLATGEYPVRGRSVHELRLLHTRSQRISIRDVRPSVPKSLARVIDAAIDPAPERRPQSAGVLCEQLLQLQRQARRRPLVYQALALAALVVAGVAAWWWRPVSTPPSPPPSVGASLPTSSSSSAVAPAASAPDAPAAGVAIPPAAPTGEGLKVTSGPPNEPTPLPSPPAAAQGPRARRSIQVLPLTNTSGRTADAWLSGVLAEMVFRELRGSESFRWIPGATAPEKAQLGTALWTFGHPGGLLEIGTGQLTRPIVPADVIVSGNFIMVGRVGVVNVFLRIEDSTGPAAAAILEETGSTEQLGQLVSRLGARALSSLGAPPLSASQAIAVAASQPANAEAARAYVEGLAMPEAGVEAMQRAVAADPRFAPARIALAEALWRRGHDAEARAAATSAVQASVRYPREEQALIKIRGLTVEASDGYAVQTIPVIRSDIFRSLAEQFPDTVLYKRQVAQSLRLIARYPEALAVVDDIVGLPGAKEDVDLLRLEWAASIGARDYPRARRALQGLDAIATRLGDQTLLGSVRYDQSLLARHMGESTEALAFIQEAVRHFVASARTPQFTVAMSAIAQISRSSGGFASVSRIHNEMIAKAAATGDRTSAGILRYSLAGLMTEHGALAQARALWEELAASWESDLLPPEYGTGAALGAGIVLYRQGDLLTAETRLEAALAEALRRGDRDRALIARHQLAQVQADLGSLAKARDHADLAGSADAPNFRLAGLTVVTETQLAQGQTDAASHSFRDANATPLVTGSDPYFQPFEFGMLRMRWAMDAGRPVEARGLARSVINRAADDFRPDDQAAAEILVALAWLSEGNLPEARQAMTQVEPRLQATEDRLLQLKGGIARARIRAAAKTVEEFTLAKKELDALIRDAGSRNAVAIALDARLALGEVEIASGDVAAGQTRLRNLSRDAAELGFVRLSKQAAAAAAGPARSQ
jgi:serine/threonine-protein kinase